MKRRRRFTDKAQRKLPSSLKLASANSGKVRAARRSSLSARCASNSVRRPSRSGADTDQLSREQPPPDRQPTLSSVGPQDRLWPGGGSLQIAGEGALQTVRHAKLDEARTGRRAATTSSAAIRQLRCPLSYPKSSPSLRPRQNRASANKKLSTRCSRGTRCYTSCISI